jgi:hypothetical protein
VTCPALARADAQDPCCVPCVDGAWNDGNRHASNSRGPRQRFNNFGTNKCENAIIQLRTSPWSVAFLSKLNFVFFHKQVRDEFAKCRQVSVAPPEGKAGLKAIER